MQKPEPEDSFDAVVVGSGYGGSVAACRMSLAGFKVCLLEKGRKWEARDFPTTCSQMFSASRLENRNLGFDLGPKDALFQVHIQEDALAATACGLGGGSLVNAGVVVPPTVRSRRHPRWPKAWEEDWEACESSASKMLRAQSVPTKFRNSEIMEGVVGEDFDKETHNPIKLSVNFDIEQLSGSKESGSCLACGNCLAGCPYDAKISTDKTYLAAAIQAGCVIKTQCEVQYVVRNYEDDSCKEEGRLKPRRWVVFLNEFDYIESDVVILSAGVFGTAKILFQSQLRGLRLSDKLGSGLSCNGNNVAYLVGSSAPLNATGLDRKQFPSIPFQERPGPSISSSYTSSLGFSIQSAVIPTAYPTFLCKGITTYGCRTGSILLYIITDWLKQVLGLNRGQDMILNAIGHDESNGKLTFEKDSNKILFHPPHDHLLPQKVKAFQKLAKKLGGVLFMSRFRSTSVHHLGGCIASSDVSSGVCNHKGQVFDTESPSGVHPGLYACDASLVPCSVGINPCLTIASIAEHVSKHLVRDNKPAGSIYGGNNKPTKRCDLVTTTEVMRGQLGGMPCMAYLKLRFETVENNPTGKNSPPILRGKVGGYIECRGLEMDNMYVVRGEVDLCGTDMKTPYTQYMNYRLILAASSGSRYVFEGKKIMNPYLLALYAWSESTTLNVTLRKITDNTNAVEDKITDLKGKLRVSLLELLKSAWALEGGNRFKFVLLLMESLYRTYIVQAPRGINLIPVNSTREPYPDSTTHEIKTDDNLTIRCQHWECKEKHKPEKRKYPVLLINGYATESYCLPTEKNDLIRTLLKDGYDVWLLHARVHWSISSNQFTVEDIGRFDIPAAINKMIEFYGESVKAHVVAHCVGGLAIHISLMGAHVSSKHVASLCCTNSSMFYKLTASSSIKMRLPLLPISMAILGKNKTLPMLRDSTTTSFRHRILKSIARRIPRYQKCPFDECEVFSGIFGNAFWHENVSESMHIWMNEENLPRLPMAAFPHLRRICRAGFIVDSEGKNSYLIYPERMSMPTLYVSGGRTLLVTPETSFLANKYMKMHQPGFRHERVVVDGFGHSDLLIGEKSAQMVFPHIQKHVELAEEESDHSECMKEALAWSVDPYGDDDEGGFGSLIFSFITVVFTCVSFRIYFLLIYFFNYLILRN